MRKLSIALCCLALAACGGSTTQGADAGAGSGHDAGATVDAGTTRDAGSASDAGLPDAGTVSDGGSIPDAGPVDAGCRPPRDPSLARMVVISHPFADDGGPSPAYEVLRLDATGKVSATGATFTMHPASQGHIAFTPDGKMGFVPQDDGSLGVFSLAADGGVQVVNPGLTGFYARQVSVSPDGRTVYVIDADTLNNGGGLYALPLACDGTLGQPTKLGTFDTPAAFTFLHGQPKQMVIAGVQEPDAGNPYDFVHIDLASGSPVSLGNALLYPNHDALPSAVALTHDNGYALVADDGFLAGSRLAVAQMGPNGPTAIDILNTPNPADVVTSPFDDTALVLNSDGQDNLTRVAFDPANTAHPFSIAGTLTYSGPKPQLPAEAVVLTRGALRGRVVVAELAGVRQEQFEPDGGIADLSLYGTGGGFTDIVGAMGVQP